MQYTKKELNKNIKIFKKSNWNLGTEKLNHSNKNSVESLANRTEPIENKVSDWRHSTGIRSIR
jgi:hypothetical protein